MLESSIFINEKKIKKEIIKLIKLIMHLVCGNSQSEIETIINKKTRTCEVLIKIYTEKKLNSYTIIKFINNYIYSNYKLKSTTIMK